MFGGLAPFAKWGDDFSMDSTIDIGIQRFIIKRCKGISAKIPKIKLLSSS